MGARDVGTIVGESLCRDVRGKATVAMELQGDIDVAAMVSFCNELAERGERGERGE